MVKSIIDIIVCNLEIFLTILIYGFRIEKNIEVLRGRVKIPTGGKVREPKG